MTLAAGGWAQAVVTYIDPPDILIPFSFGGVYLDIETAAENSSSSSGAGAVDSYTISYTEPASGDWDVNFFFGGALVLHNTSFQPYREDNSDAISAIHNVAVGSVIDGSAVSPEPASGSSSPLTTVSLGASGTTTGGDINGNQTPTHMGAAGDQFASGSGTEGYIAFVLNPGPGELYGWIRVTLSDDGSTGLIHDWAYSDVAIEVGQVPEPGSVALLGLGVLSLMRRRR